MRWASIVNLLLLCLALVCQYGWHCSARYARRSSSFFLCVILSRIRLAILISMRVAVLKSGTAQPRALLCDAHKAMRAVAVVPRNSPSHSPHEIPFPVRHHPPPSTHYPVPFAVADASRRHGDAIAQLQNVAKIISSQALSNSSKF